MKEFEKILRTSDDRLNESDVYEKIYRQSDRFFGGGMEAFGNHDKMEKYQLMCRSYSKLEPLERRILMAEEEFNKDEKAMRIKRTKGSELIKNGINMIRVIKEREVIDYSAKLELLFDVYSDYLGKRIIKSGLYRVGDIQRKIEERKGILTSCLNQFIKNKIPLILERLSDKKWISQWSYKGSKSDIYFEIEFGYETNYRGCDEIISLDGLSWRHQFEDPFWKKPKDKSFLDVGCYVADRIEGIGYRILLNRYIFRK